MGAISTCSPGSCLILYRHAGRQCATGPESLLLKPCGQLVMFGVKLPHQLCNPATIGCQKRTARMAAVSASLTCVLCVQRYPAKVGLKQA